jgi:hypothetical protein
LPITGVFLLLLLFFFLPTGTNSFSYSPGPPSSFRSALKPGGHGFESLQELTIAKVFC